jgi:eukaryotic-like serine/threonine-protein kinase
MPGGKRISSVQATAKCTGHLPAAYTPAQERHFPMSLSTGTRLGPYEILALIGAGGMGEVYRAHDTLLNRHVAIKVLPDLFADDPDRLARFEREAQVLASLNHPHIAHIHGREESGRVRALVMELVEGESLAEKIARGPLPLDEALSIARQIAEALETAHERAIVHRDLKPANIKITPDGTVKVLDFGLAKAFATSGVSTSATLTALGTETGLILGTAAYMAPEQAKGKSVDRRADIWALGCVLFEMLTGQRAFAGETPSDVLVRIIEHEPDWQTLPEKTPVSIRRLLHRCFEKDPKRRLDSAAIARIEIDEAGREPTPILEAAVARRGSLWLPIVWAAAGAGIAVLLTTMSADRANTTEPRSLAAITALVDIPGVLRASPGVHFAVAPSGRSVVFPSDYGGSPVLYRRDLDRIDPQPIVGTDDGTDVFFSHDGRRLGFEKRSELWTVSLDGGTPQRVLPNLPLRGGTWGEGDNIVVGRVGSGLWMASPTGGEPRQLTAPKQGDRHELPQMLPGGRAVLFTVLPIDKPPQAAVYVFGSGETRALFEGVGARFVGSGHIVFGRQEKLWAVGFDHESLETLGAPRPVRDDVLWSTTGYPQFAVNADVLAYVRRNQAYGGEGHSVPTWVDRQGRKTPLALKANNFMLPRLSPAADRLVLQVGASRDLWTYDFGRGTLTKLTSDRIIAFSAPAWTLDGSRVAFATWFDGDVGLGWVHSDGSGQIEELIKGIGMRSFERTHPVMLPDGSGLIMTGLAPGTTVEDLLFVRLNQERRLETLFQAPGVERNPSIAPSGRFIAYNSDESGRTEVYVRPFPNAGSRKWQISTDGGTGPVWTRGGSEIVYMDSQGRMTAVAVRSDGKEPHFSRPEPLFKIQPGGDSGLDRGWDVSADGERFLFLMSDSTAETALQLMLIQNWADELKRLVPREQ